jgi:hypothetical protein
VEQVHWNTDCIKMANCLLKLMVTRKIINDKYAEEPEDDIFRDDKVNGNNYSLMTTHNTLMPLKHPNAVVDTISTITESII